MRLIDADALIKKFQSDKEYFDKVGDTTFAMATIGVINDIDNAPTIDAVSVVRGEWIEHKARTIVMDNNFVDFFPAEYECSNCGLREAHYFINSKPHNYCPNCGAKMDGERKNND